MHVPRPTAPGVDGSACIALAVRGRAADGARQGGDVHATAPTPAGPRLLLADVKGHGANAAPLAAAVLAAFHHSTASETDPVRLVRTLDARLAPHLSEEDFVTLLLADCHPDEIRLVNCGHPPPVRIGRRLTSLPAPSPSPPLGLGPDPRIQRLRLLPDQRLLLHTDGLTEARNPDGVLFSLDQRALAALRAATLDQALDGLLDLLHQHTERVTTADDLTLLLLQPTRAIFPSPH
ncbi:PP2C family protein-serine/threonine phosphatase [Streptomyces venezuelae]|uniref:PP2C family protein-serine/threonine phosphatase n=1 Tax=Streptomyces venezuelae TaxID=54571 RepID=UPI00343F242C